MMYYSFVVICNFLVVNVKFSCIRCNRLDIKDGIGKG